MAKLKTESMGLRDDSGKLVQYKCPVYVSVSGDFSMQVPDDLLGVAQDLVSHRKGVSLSKFVATSSGRMTTRVCANALAACKDFLYDCIREFISDVEIQVERVIVYDYQVQVAYWKNRDGSISPNGSFGDHSMHRTNEDQGWFVGTLQSSHTTKYYSMGLVAKAYEKITYTRNNSSETVYRITNHAQNDLDGKIPKEEMPQRNDHMDRLNAFIGIQIHNPEKLTEIPYTDDAADFFYQIMLEMCVTADRMESFFENRDRVLEAISRYSPNSKLLS